MNTTISLALNNFAYSHSIIRVCAIFMASDLQYVIAIVLLIFIFRSKKNLTKNRIKKNIFIAISSVTSGLIARVLIKPIILFFIHIPRPYVSLSQIHLLIPPLTAENYQSFPSGHALFFFAIAYMIYLYNKRWGYFFLSLATLMVIGRVMVGVHYPLDILGGAAIGILVSICLFKLINTFLIQTKIKKIK